MMGWIAGLYLSDYLDRKLDKIQKPHRPIPSGKIKPKEAILVGLLFVVGGFFLSVLISPRLSIIIIVTAILVFTYSSFSKSRGFIGNLNRGFVIVAAYFFGVFSTIQNIDLIPSYIWLLSFVFLIHDTNSNLIGALRDMEGDKKGGYNTIPVRYGVKKSIYISSVLTLIWFPLAIYIPFHYKFLKNEFYLIMILDLFIIILLYINLIGSIKKYSREKALKFHKFFVIERVVLASAFIFGIVNIYLATTIFLSALVLTAIFQYHLRRRYEFAEVSK
jgi:4-hydroxybenzoate polyprenyltransferase/geranylgeranylglycerol-phosphate geranylgeranyltransferase